MGRNKNYYCNKIIITEVKEKQNSQEVDNSLLLLLLLIVLLKFFQIPL